MPLPVLAAGAAKAGAAALQALPVVVDIAKTVLPYFTQNVQTGTGSGSSSNASSQTSQGFTSGSSGMTQSGTSMQQGSISGIAGMLSGALGTPTGSNWQQAFNANVGQAQTANNLQTGQWTMAQGMNAFSNMIQNLSTAVSVSNARAYNRQQAQAQRDWTRSMRQTAYQDTVADLKKAGLNPILAAGNGATGIGSGSSASTSAGQYSSMTSAAIPSAHAATAQTMYDYGNNTMQFLNHAMQTINNARQIGATSLEQGAWNITKSVMEASMSSTAEYANQTEQIAEQHLKGLGGGKDATGTMGGGNSHGGGGGRGR